MMQAEGIKGWLRQAEAEERAQKKRTEGLDGPDDTWHLLVRLIRHIWDMGETPTLMLLMIVVLIPKGTSGDFRKIGLLEVM